MHTQRTIERHFARHDIYLCICTILTRHSKQRVNNHYRSIYTEMSADAVTAHWVHQGVKAACHMSEYKRQAVCAGYRSIGRNIY